MDIKQNHEQAQEREAAQTGRPRSPVFQSRGILHVTNFEAETPDDPLGYLCGGRVQLFSDGDLILASEEDDRILETIHLADVITGSDTIRDYDPAFQTMASLMTMEKHIRIEFQSVEMKREFWNAVTAVYGSLKTAEE